MKPQKLKTKIFIDTGDPNETNQAIDLLGFLDGQTTNPTLVAKLNSDGNKFTKQEALDFYKKHVKQISDLIPEGSVSIEVYADKNTSTEEMVTQAKEMFTWIPNAHIKLPTTKKGIEAGIELFKQDMRLNYTLIFTQDQAAAIMSAFKDAKPGQIFVSPFVGRLDDLGENGMELIKNIVQMKKEAQSNIEVLTASVRSMDHFLYAIALNSDIITSPFKILKEWAQNNSPVPQAPFNYNTAEKSPIEYKTLDVNRQWTDFDLHHELTEKGIERFASDWNSIIKS